MDAPYYNGDDDRDSLTQPDGCVICGAAEDDQHAEDCATAAAARERDEHLRYAEDMDACDRGGVA